jgi:hypothetical protein
VEEVSRFAPQTLTKGLGFGFFMISDSWFPATEIYGVVKWHKKK